MLNLVVIMTATEPFYRFLEAKKILDEKYPGEFNLYLYDTAEVDSDEEIYSSCMEQTENANFVYIKTHGSIVTFKRFNKYFDNFKDKKKFYIDSVPEEIQELLNDSNIRDNDYKEIFAYTRAGGTNNCLNMIKFIAKEFVQMDITYDAVKPSRTTGIYDPDVDTTDEEKYLEEVRNTSKPVVGIYAMAHTIVKEATVEHINAIIRSIRKQGGVPLCIYSDMTPNLSTGSEGFCEALKKYMTYNGETIVGSILNTSPFSISIMCEPDTNSKPKDKSVFEITNVPTIQVMTTLKTGAEWKESPQGLDGMLLSPSVFQPEFDGQLIAYPIASREDVRLDLGTRKVPMPIMERTERAVKLAINYAKLRLIPDPKKKIAIILHNNPPTNANIGSAAGLDTPVSVYRMIEKLEDCGVKTDFQFKDGKDIIDRIIGGLTNDGRWSSPNTMLEKSIDTVDRAQYNKWYDNFDPKIQKNLSDCWGEPVGDFMAVDDKLLVPGILNGNIFIGLQPPRALEEKAEEMYHSTDIPCPHQYIGFYRWVEEIFNADVIIHVGTHGTLEWLPGKEIGLSKDCYPDICIGTIPHLYFYVITGTGEGTQAKRRSYAGLIEYMIPSMMESGVYDEIAEMDELIKQYYHVRLADENKLPIVKRQIIDLAVKINLNDDIGLSMEQLENDTDSCIEKIHSWLSNVQACEINDGFHILGKIPEGVRFRNMLKMLVRTRNGDIPSLRTSICEMLGLDFEELLAHPETATDDGKSYGILLSEADEIGRQIFMELEKHDYDPQYIHEVVEQFKISEEYSVSKLKTCLNYACTSIKGNILKMPVELDNFIGGIHGKFVPPGQGGAPTRGNADILPTGRNFYTVDPGAIPTRASWEIGKVLGDQLIKRYQSDEGKYPESVAIIVHATDTMRSNGDDISEIYHLLGVKPVWLGNTEKVVDLEVISLEELGRPRIDVTLRISGMFRDSFPNLIERVEDAVNLVASLDEPADKNYIKKHVDEEIAEMLEKGIALEKAMELAHMRIFGDALGAYGTGVSALINSKKWNDVTDIGKVFTTWGCYAYGKNVHGDKMEEVFSLRMKKASLAVKNYSTREFDIFDGDDFYSNLGGLVATITTHSGEQKPAYYPSSSDPDHVETLSLHEEVSRVMRSKINNPKWIEGLKPHGYRGAKQVASMVSYALGWDATSNVIDDWMYNCIAERYAFNKENSDWMRESNPWALHSVAETLLEAHQRELWNAPEESVEKLKQIYMEMEGKLEGIE